MVRGLDINIIMRSLVQTSISLCCRLNYRESSWQFLKELYNVRNFFGNVRNFFGSVRDIKKLAKFRYFSLLITWLDNIYDFYFFT